VKHRLAASGSASQGRGGDIAGCGRRVIDGTDHFANGAAPFAGGTAALTCAVMQESSLLGAVSPRWVAAPAALVPFACEAASTGNAAISAVMLPVMLAFGIGLHALIARSVKTVLAAARPLASGEPEACGYERRVYHTAAPQMLGVVVAALIAGLVLWVGYATGSGWIGALGVLAVLVAVGLDLWWWERVTASASYLWFQRGFKGHVHQVLIDNILDISVDETEVGGFTLRHGRKNAVCRLMLRLNDKHMVALPKTDAYNGLADVEAVANHLRARKQQSDDRRSLAQAQALAARAAAEAAEAGPSKDAEMLLELRRLRQKALSPDLPPAVPPAVPKE